MPVKPTLYLIPGFLTNETIYRNLRQELHYPTQVLEFISPLENESIQNYAARLAQKINQNEPFSILGTSFGGMLALEIAKITQPRQVIIVSSAKNKNELAKFMKTKYGETITAKIPPKFLRQLIIQSYTVGGTFFKAFKPIYKPEIKAMLHGLDGKTEKWIMGRFEKWDNDSLPSQFLHIHGDNDKVFPIKNIKNATIIPKGTHAMIMTRYKTIAKLINQFLDSKN